MRTPHVDQSYEAELNALNTLVVKMGVRAEGMISDAVRALVERDPVRARGVITIDRELNGLENECDQACLKILARRSPVGADLRLVTCALKVVTDLERIGDLATNIAKRSLELMDKPGLEATQEVAKLGDLAVELTSRAVRALQERDANAARAIRAQDRALDVLNKAVFSQMILFAKDHSDQLERAIAYTSVSRHFERVGDHAVNVAEMVVFLAEGKTIRHTPDE